MHIKHFTLLATALAGMGLWSGCNNGAGALGGSAEQEVPHPVNLMLPKSIRITPFTGMRAFDDAGGVKGIDVHIEAKDTYGDTTRAFGDFRFELYEFKPNSLDPKGAKLGSWDVPVLKPDDNRRHWDPIHRAYEFKLQWDQPIAVGRRFVLVAVFDSPFTDRIFNERVFVSGE